jgi:diguanylate cyclase (GGDEF)-like protein
MPSKILLVNDSKEQRAVIKKALKGIFLTFLEAEDGQTAIKIFTEEKPGFIITDVTVPSVSGYKFVSTVRSMEHGKDVPIVLLSDTKVTLKKKLRGFDLGASDFIIKPYDEEELVARVKSLLRIRHMILELKEKNSLLETLAVTDELTGLYNRRHFFESIKQQLALGMRHNFNLACMLMDIDHFKMINDTYGHIAGDVVLRKIGALLNNGKRSGELLARYGGEEFVICLFNTDTKSSLKAAERFRKLIKSHDFSTDAFPDLDKITMSIGVAIAEHNAAVTIDIDELLATADQALYKSKTDGRDRVSLFEWEPSP